MENSHIPEKALNLKPGDKFGPERPQRRWLYNIKRE
jgi:hypothetical protein